MDAEQNYGIMGEYAGDAGTTPRLGGDPAGWRRLPTVQTAPTPQDPGCAGSGRVRMSRLSTWRSSCGRERSPGALRESRSPSTPTSHESVSTGFPQARCAATSDSSSWSTCQAAAADGCTVTPDYNRHYSRLQPGTGDDEGRFSRRPVITRDRDGRAIRFALRHHQPGSLRAGRNVLPGSGIRSGQAAARHRGQPRAWPTGTSTSRLGCSSFGFPGTCSM